MNLKLLTGKAVDVLIEKTIETNHKLVPFIPNGRILPLDLKRASISPEIIFDVGANIGQTSNYFARHFPGSRIYCFEPVLSTYNELLANIKSKHIHPFNEALGSIIQSGTIYKNDTSRSSSLNGDDGRFTASELVRVNTGENFVFEHQIQKIDLLKIDVEGYELNVLKGFGGFLNSKVKMIYAEVGFDKSDPYKTYISDLLALTGDYGFAPAGFYEPYRWGFGKFNFFSNILLTNRSLIGC